MLGVNESRARLGLALFSAACLIGLFGLTWYEVRHNTTDGVLDTIIAIGQNMEWVVVVSAAFVYIGVEVPVMIAEMYLKKRYQDGRRDNEAKWRAWYERWQAAKQRGEPFDEPPPQMPETKG